MACYQFRGACEFDSASGEVHRQGFVTRLEPRPAALLALLADRAGNIVSHEEIRRALRPSLRGIDFRKRVQSFIRQIRAALGDRAQAPRIIETIPRRGYRLKREAMSGGGGDSGHGDPQREGTLRTRSPKWLARNSRFAVRVFAVRVFAVRGFAGSRVRGFAGSRVRGFAGAPM